MIKRASLRFTGDGPYVQKLDLANRMVELESPQPADSTYPAGDTRDRTIRGPAPASDGSIFLSSGVWTARRSGSYRRAMATVEVLRRVPFLKGVGTPELEALASRATSRRLLRGEVLFEEGEPAKGLLVVATGSVKITKLSESGREQVLTIEGPGSSVAEVPLFDGGPYPATAVALEPATVLSIPRAEFFTVMRNHPEIGIALVENIGGRLRQLVFLVEELSLKEVGQRLAGYILDQARRRGKPGPDGKLEVELDLSNQEIGSRIGTVRELVSRCIGRLRNARIIGVDDRRIRILDLDALETEAQSGK